jgi:microcystin-dependent protein
MAIVAYPLPCPKFGNGGFNDVGAIVPGGKLFTYAAGTLTPKDTYPSATSLSFPNANPVVLDSEGRADIFVEPDEAYDLVFTDENDVELWTALSIAVPPIQAPPVDTNVPSGGILLWGAAAAPTGYVLCDGSAISRVTFAALFAVIGTTYGVGNGTTTFNVPDMRQRFPLGKSASGTGAALGDTGGTIDHVHSGPSHTHNIAGHTHTIAHTHSVPRDGWGHVANTPGVDGRVQTGDSTAGGPDSTEIQATADNTSGASSAANSGSTPLTTDSGGTADTGSANPKFLVVNYIIKT